MILMMALMLPMLVMSSCSDNDNSSYMEALCGVWEEYDNPLGIEVFHIELRQDGTGEQWAEDYGEVDEYGKTPFTWSAGESTITVSIAGEGTQTMSYSLDGDMLSISYEGETIRYVRSE